MTVKQHKDVKTPFISVVVPTRNRAELLTQSALPTVLQQTFEDFELVICDNASSDDTEERVMALKDNRIKFFRSEEWIPKEDFFQWSLERASGEYSMLFFDDDALCRRALEKCHTILREKPVEALTFARSLVYHFPNWHAPKYRNVLSIPQFSKKAFLIDSRRHLERVYQHMDILVETPMVTNALYRSSFIKDLADQHGRLFPHGHMGDYNVACWILNYTKEFVYLDDPIAVFGHWKENTSAQLHDFQTTMPEYQEWIDWITAEHLSKMPWTQYIWPNCVAAALEDMNRQLGMNIEVDPVQYWFEMFREIKRVVAAGGNADQEDLELTLKEKASPQVVKKVMEAVRDGNTLAKISDQIRTLDYQDPNQAYPNDRSILGKQFLHKTGKLNGFNDVSGACKFFECISGEENLLDKRTRREKNRSKSTCTKEAGLCFNGETKDLPGKGDYPALIRQTSREDWRLRAAEALIGKTDNAIKELAEIDGPEARFYLGVAHWMAGQDREALAVLRKVDTEHARNLASLIAKPKLRVLAQTDWFPEDITDKKFAVQFMGIRRKELGPRGFGIPTADMPLEAFENITHFANTEPADFYFAHMVEWELLPRDLPELECPKIAVTSDVDWHAQELYPWLPVFDEVVATGSEERSETLKLDPKGSVSVFPKVFGLRDQLLPELPGCEREVNLFVSGSYVGPFHEDKAQLIRQLLDSNLDRIRYVDGYMDLGDYFNENGQAKAVFTYVRQHPGTMPTRGLEALAMGCAVVTQKDCSLSLYYGSQDGVFSYEKDKQDLAAQIHRISDHWEELGQRLQKTAKTVRQEFNLSRCTSQFLRYATVLAAKPRARRKKPTTRHLMVAKRHFSERGHPQSLPAANLMLQHNWRCWEEDYHRHGDPGSLINMGRELDLFLNADMGRLQKLKDNWQIQNWQKTRRKMLKQVESVYGFGIRTHQKRLVLLFNALRHAFHIGNSSQVPHAINMAESLLEKQDSYWEINLLDDVFPWDYMSAYFNFRKYSETVFDGLTSGNDRQSDLIRLIRASIHYYLGHLKGGMDHFEKAVELDPDFPYYRYYLAMALLDAGGKDELTRATNLLEDLARDSIMMETAFNCLAGLHERKVYSSPLINQMARQMRRLKRFRMDAFGSSGEFETIDLVLPPGTKALPTQQIIKRQASSLRHTEHSSHCVNVGRVGESKKILLIPFELANWKNGRAWSYTGNFGFEEGLTANGIDCTVMPAIAGLRSDDQASWLDYAALLFKDKKFDQVWIWITHNHYTPEFFAWLKTIAPVRVGIVMESMEHSPQELKEMAKVGERKQKVLRELRHMTHVVTYDDADANMFDRELGKPALWCPIFVPWHNVTEKIKLPSPGPGVFLGSTYNAERKAYLDYDNLKDYLVSPELPESHTRWPAQFDQLQANCLHFLKTTSTLGIGDFNNYVILLRAIRRELFNLWLEGLQLGYTTVNLPSICKFYPGRVVESMAAGRPVITPQPKGRAMQQLFEPGREILWYDRNRPSTLRDQIQFLHQHPEQAQAMAERARDKVLKYHTAEIRARQILDWIESGAQPNFGLGAVPQDTALADPAETIIEKKPMASTANQMDPYPSMENPLEALKTKAHEYYQQGQLEKAKLTYQQLTDMLPDEPAVWVELATVCLQSKDGGGFEKALNHALQLDPTDFEARRLLAHANFMGGKYVDACGLYAGLVKDQPEDLELTLAFGAANFHTRSFHDAVGAFEQALVLDPSNQVARDNLKAAREASEALV